MEFGIQEVIALWGRMRLLYLRQNEVVGEAAMVGHAL